MSFRVIRIPRSGDLIGRWFALLLPPSRRVRENSIRFDFVAGITLPKHSNGLGFACNEIRMSLWRVGSPRFGRTTLQTEPILYLNWIGYSRTSSQPRSVPCRLPTLFLYSPPPPPLVWEITRRDCFANDLPINRLIIVWLTDLLRSARK